MASVQYKCLILVHALHSRLTTDHRRGEMLRKLVCNSNRVVTSKWFLGLYISRLWFPFWAAASQGLDLSFTTDTNNPISTPSDTMENTPPPLWDTMETTDTMPWPTKALPRPRLIKAPSTPLSLLSLLTAQHLRFKSKYWDSAEIASCKCVLLYNRGVILLWSDHISDDIPVIWLRTGLLRSHKLTKVLVFT